MIFGEILLHQNVIWSLNGTFASNVSNKLAVRFTKCINYNGAVKLLIKNHSNSNFPKLIPVNEFIFFSFAGNFKAFPLNCD